MGERPTILLADDEEAITAELQPFLERAGFSVLVARDGEAALAAGSAREPGPDRARRAHAAARRPRGAAAPARRRPLHARSSCSPRSAPPASARWRSRRARTTTSTSRSTRASSWPASAPCCAARQPGQPSLAATRTLASGPLQLDRVARRAWLDGAELHLTPEGRRAARIPAHPPRRAAHPRAAARRAVGLGVPGRHAGGRQPRRRAAARAGRRCGGPPPGSRPSPGQGYRFAAPVQGAGVRRWAWVAAPLVLLRARRARGWRSPGPIP